MHKIYSSHLLTTEYATSRASSLRFPPSCQNQAPFLGSAWGGVLLNPAQATIKVATAYVPPFRTLEPSHDGAVLLLNPLSGVFDTVSRSHFDRSRIAARLKSRFALDAGVDFRSRFFGRPEAGAEGGL